MKNVLKNGGLYVIANIINKIIAFITIPIFTRLMTTSEYGIVNTYASWVEIGAVIIGLCSGQTVRNIYIEKKDKLGEYISSILTIGLVNLLFASIVLLVYSYWHSSSYILLQLCLIESFSNFAINTVLLRYLMQEDALKRTIFTVCPYFIGSVVSVALVLSINTNKEYGRIIGTCISASAFALGICLYYFSRFRSFVRFDYWKYILSISLPLVFHGLSLNVLAVSDRSMITFFKNPSETAIYSLTYNVGMVASIIRQSAEMVWIPRMTRDMINKNYRKINWEVDVYLILVTGAFCGILTIAPELIDTLGGNQYSSGKILIVPIVASSFFTFLYGIYVNLEYYYKKTRLIAINSVIAALLNLILNLIFIPKFGAFAAAITTLISYLFSFLFHSICSKQIDKMYVPYKQLVFPIIIFCISCIITYIFRDNILCRWVVMLLLGLSYSAACYIWIQKTRTIGEDQL